MNTQQTYKVMDNIAEQILAGKDLSGFSAEEKSKIKENILNLFYDFLIVRFLEALAEDKKSEVLESIQKSKGDMEIFMDILSEHHQQPEVFVAQTIDDLAKRLDEETLRTLI